MKQTKAETETEGNRKQRNTEREREEKERGEGERERRLNMEGTLSEEKKFQGFPVLISLLLLQWDSLQKTN